MPDTLFQSETIVILDFETTGLSAINDRVIEVAALRYRNGRLDETFTTLINPGFSPSPRIVEITGIDAGMLRGAPAPEYVFPRLVRFLEGHPVLAHNAPFDQKFFEAEVRRAGVRWPGDSFNCTLKLSRKAWPGLASYRLGDLAREFKLPLEGNLHRAEADARLTGHLFAAIRSKLGHPQGQGWPSQRMTPCKTTVEASVSTSGPNPPPNPPTGTQPATPPSPRQTTASSWHGWLEQARSLSIDPTVVKQTLASKDDALAIRISKDYAGWSPDRARFWQQLAEFVGDQSRIESRDDGHSSPMPPPKAARTRPTSVRASLLDRALAGDLEATIALAQRALDGRDLGEATHHLRGLLEASIVRGSLEAARLRGELARFGHFPGEGLAVSLQYLERAATMGSHTAAFTLGALHHEGSGMYRNITKALTWYERGARGGSAPAAFNLGVMYANGDGVAANGPLAARWYESAFKLGEPDAAFNLALLHEQGALLPKDLTKAILWFGNAADAGHREAREHQRTLKSEAKTASKKPKKAASEQPQKKKVDLALEAARSHLRHLEKAAMKRRDHDAAFQIAHGYDTGTWGAPDRERAVHWYNVAVALGSQHAKLILAMMTLSPRNVPLAK